MVPSSPTWSQLEPRAITFNFQTHEELGHVPGPSSVSLPTRSLAVVIFLLYVEPLCMGVPRPATDDYYTPKKTLSSREMALKAVLYYVQGNVVFI